MRFLEAPPGYFSLRPIIHRGISLLRSRTHHAARLLSRRLDDPILPPFRAGRFRLPHGGADSKLKTASLSSRRAPDLCGAVYFIRPEPTSLADDASDAERLAGICRLSDIRSIPGSPASRIVGGVEIGRAHV